MPSFFMLLCIWMHAQEVANSNESNCLNGRISSIPSRPTVTNATDTTQCGVVELEYGLERQWSGVGALRDDLSGGLRFGLTPNLGFHWSSGDFLNVVDGSGSRTGFGDTWLGLRYKLSKQTKKTPSFGVFYAAKMPSAGAALGGSGHVDHSLSFLASKDIRRLHFDFNFIELLAGRTLRPGFDHNSGFALASWLTVTQRFNLVLEPYGYTLLNHNNAAFSSMMIGFNYKVQSRLYLDTGVDVGVTSYAPHKRVYIGITYAIVNLYAWIKTR
ncbi:MAG TPA: hypothetical protein VFA74_17915 [Terriglobales bacterium]|nr:hypothetical protein [Terriglobales bacterium]